MAFDLGKALLGLAAVNPQYANLLQNTQNAEREEQLQRDKMAQEQQLMQSKQQLKQQEAQDASGVTSLLTTPTFLNAPPVERVKMLSQFSTLPPDKIIGYATGAGKLMPSPEKRDYTTDITGVKRYVDTGEQVFPDVKGITPEEKAAREQEDFIAKEKIKADIAFEKDQKAQLNKGYTPEQATKMSMMKQGLRIIPKVETSIIKNGQLDKGLLAQIWADTPLTPEAQQVRSELENAIAAQLRPETGAAISDEEFKLAKSRYIPNPLDSVETAKAKLSALKEVISGTLELIKPATARGKDGAVNYMEYFK